MLKEYIKKSFYTLLHPVAGINDFIEENKFSFRYSLLIFAVFYLVNVLKLFATGFSFTTASKNSTDVGITFIALFGIIALWSVSNWSISTLFDGKGKFKQITFVTMISLIPYTGAIFINVILSNVLTSSEGIFMTVISVIGIAWSVMLIVVGLMILHDYSLWGVIISSIASIAAIVVILFLGLLCFSLVRQFYSFLSDIINEISYRI